MLLSLFSPSVQRFGGTLLSGIGSGIQANAYRTAAATSRAAANYNAQVEKVNTERDLIKLGRQVSSFLDTQKAQAATTNLQVGSKSFLALMNDSLSQYEGRVLNDRNVSKQTQEAIKFEGESRARASEQRARNISLGNIFNTILGG